MASFLNPPELPSLADLHEQDARHLRLLVMRMAERGARMAELYVQQAEDQVDQGKPGAGPSPSCATAYGEVSRSVRQSVMLVQKLTAPEPKAVAPAQDRVAARKQIIRDVEDAVYRHAEPEKAERLQAELMERLESPAFEADLEQRPAAEIAREIECDLGVHGDLGLSFWKRRTPADLAHLDARAAAPGRAGSAWPVEAIGRDAALHDTPPIRGP